MGIYDRDYYRHSPPRGGFGHFVAGSITTWLIIINVVVFFADGVLHRVTRQADFSTVDDDGSIVASPRTENDLSPPLTRWGSFSVQKGIEQGQIWRVVTFQFLHSDPWHLIGNMFGLYLFGPIVEAHFGRRRYLAFYLLCGLAGAMLFLIFAYLGIIHVGIATTLVGASGGIFGLLVASAMIAPDVQVFYYFFPVTIRFLAIGGMALAVYSVVALGGNAGGEASHLGGGALGYLLIKNQHWLNVFEQSRGSAVALPLGRNKRRPKAFQKDWSKDLNR